MGHKQTLIGTEGDDTISGTNFSKDTIYGLGGDDLLFGGAHNDTLIGGAGADTLDGGTGKDVFLFESVSDSLPGHADLILDLHDQDRIDLSAIDADTTQDGDQAFHLVSAFTGHAGELTLSFDKATHATILQGDVDGDGQADLEIDLAHHHTDFTNFVL